MLYLVAIGVAPSIVENRRKATDRVVRGLVTVAFLLALAPLISTLWTVVANGIGRSTGLHHSARRSPFDPTPSR